MPKANDPAINTPLTTTPRRKRRWPKVLAAVAVALIVVVLLLPYIIPTTWLAGAVESAIKGQVNRPVQLGGISWGWFGGVKVNGATIGESPDFGGGTFMQFQSLSVQVSFLDLLRKKVSIKSITIKDPKVTITRNVQGAWNLDTLLVAQPARQPVAVATIGPTEQPAFDISINKIRIQGGNFTFNDQLQNLSVQASDVDVSVNTDFSGDRVKGDANISFDLIQSSSKGKFELAASDIDMPKPGTSAAAAGPLQTASAKGTITLTGIDIGDAIATSTTFGKDMADGTLSVSLDYNIKNGQATIKATDGTIRGLVLGTAAGVKTPVTIGDADFSIDATANQTAQATSAVLNSFQLTTAFMELAASGAANMAETASTIQAKASGTIDPGALPAGLVELPPDFKSQGRTRFDVAVNKTGEPIEFNATLDAGPSAVAYGTVMRKPAGRAALVSVAGDMTGDVITARQLGVTLDGAALSGSGSFDSAGQAAQFNMKGNFHNFNIADYYPAAKPLTVNGALAAAGTMLLAAGQEARPDRMVLDATLDKLSLDVPDNPGVEVLASGALSLNSVKAETKDLVVALGGSPVTINALVQSPLDGPKGSVTIRGGDLSADNLTAVANALSSAVAPAGQPTPGQPTPATTAPTPTTPPTPGEAGETALQKYARNANLTIGVNIDRVTYQDTVAQNLVVDAALINGQAIIRRATTSVFGGTVDVTSTVDLAASEQPFNVNVAIAQMQAGQAAKQYVAKYLPGVNVTGLLNLNLPITGRLAAPGGTVMNTLTGQGSTTISDGVIGLAALPQGLSALLGGLDMRSLQFSNLNIPLKLADGAVTYRIATATKPYRVFIDGQTFLAGGYVQQVAVAPEGTDSPVHLMAIRNGKPEFIPPQQFISELARSGIVGGLLQRGGQPAQPAQPGQPGQPATPEEKPSKEEQIRRGIGAAIDIFGNKDNQ